MIYAWTAVTLILVYGLGLYTPRHRHRWKIVREVTLYDPDVKSNLPSGRRIVLQCEGCGNLKAKRF